MDIHLKRRVNEGVISFAIGILKYMRPPPEKQLLMSPAVIESNNLLNN